MFGVGMSWPVQADVSVAHVVGDDEEDVGPGLNGGRRVVSGPTAIRTNAAASAQATRVVQVMTVPQGPMVGQRSDGRTRHPEPGAQHSLAEITVQERRRID